MTACAWPGSFRVPVARGAAPLRKCFFRRARFRLPRCDIYRYIFFFLGGCFLCHQAFGWGVCSCTLLACDRVRPVKIAPCACRAMRKLFGCGARGPFLLRREFVPSGACVYVGARRRAWLVYDGVRLAGVIPCACRVTRRAVAQMFVAACPASTFPRRAFSCVCVCVCVCCVFCVCCVCVVCVCVLCVCVCLRVCVFSCAWLVCDRV